MERQQYEDEDFGLLLISGFFLEADENDVPILKSLSILDRFLVFWIVLAMALGILLGNFVDSVGPSLQKGKFVGVSVPIGMFVHHTSPTETHSLAFRRCKIY